MRLPPPSRVVGRDRGPTRSREDQYHGGNVHDVLAELREARLDRIRRSRKDRVTANRGVDLLQAINMPIPMELEHDEF